MTYEEPIPLEEEFPELGEMLKNVVEINSRFPKNKTPILINDSQVFLFGRQIISDEKLPQRNDPCVCGSGKKFKKCCGGQA